MRKNWYRDNDNMVYRAVGGGWPLAKQLLDYFFLGHVKPVVSDISRIYMGIPSVFD